MASSDSVLWGSLEQWSANVFLVAGTLLLVTAVLEVLDPYVVMSTQAVGGIAGFGGTVLLFVGLLGLYPRLADRAPRLTRTGVLLMVLPVLFVFVFFVWSLLAEFLPLPSLTAMLPGGRMILMGIFLLFGVGTAIFGFVSLQTATLSRNVGVLLFVLAAAWFVFLGASIAYETLPNWTTFVVTLLQAVAVLPIGYLLRTRSEPAGRAGRTPDSPA